MKEEIKKHLEIIYNKIYSQNEIEEIVNEIFNLVNFWKSKIKINVKPLNEKSVYLITYGDSIREKNTPTLQTFQKFINKYSFKEFITDIHFLPHFPYTSDDGFSVVDYYQVDKKLGTWDDLKNIARDFNLMYDCVINHISQKSQWVKGFLQNKLEYKNFFIVKNFKWDYSKTIRPRTSPLFHFYQKTNGEAIELWSTFSKDQVDLNFKEKNVLLKSIDILMTYFYNGAKSIRLDAIGFIWKEDGLNNMHLKQCHEIVKLWRTLSDYICKDFILITETNVPFKENISYFGKEDEAHLVYQFPLPPLLLHTFTQKDTTKLTKWSKSLAFINKLKTNTFFNFFASHDGIGLKPAMGILTNEEITDLSKIALSKNGMVSYGQVNGKTIPYELNINAYSFLKENNKYDVDKFIGAYAIVLSLVGVPAIYYHSLLGSTNDVKGRDETKIPRRINREKYDFEKINNLLQDDATDNYKIYNLFKKIITIRSQYDAFHPHAQQEIWDFGKNVFSLLRIGKKDKIVFVINVTSDKIKIKIPLKGENILNNQIIENDIQLQPYEFVWIKVSDLGSKK